jgi:hypothetical protein
MVFDRLDTSKEVWRHQPDFDPDSAIQTINPPSESMYEAYHETTFPKHGSQRGCFAPWALLPMPEPTLAYRFVYPSLLTTSERRAFLFDIPSGGLVQKINIRSDNDDPGEICYVELNSTYVFVCFSSEIRVFSRSGNGRRILAVPISGFSSRAPVLGIQPGSPRRIRGPDDKFLQREKLGASHPSMRLSLFMEPEFFACKLFALRVSTGKPLKSFTSSVHVSPCGRHLAILISDNRLLLVENFERLVRGEARVEEIGTDIVFGSVAADSSRYLAFCDDKVGVATASRFLTVVSLNNGLKPLI